ncbi:MAG: aspartyl protease family protein [Gluconacetobacter diazotrophicus]|nr:aspartyl protease family protein [Gluconacetobacter diazotrophicus]
MFAAKRLLPVLLLLLSASAARAACDRDPVALPILSEDGAVIVPAEIDGVPVAAELNPHAFPSFVFDQAGLALPRLGGTDSEALAGREDGTETVLDTLRLGDAVFPGWHAVAVSEPPRPPVAGRRVAMTIGADLLDDFVLLLDLPGRRAVLFRDRGPSCPDPATLVPGRPVAVPLREGTGHRIDLVDAVLDGLPVVMEVDPGSNDTIVPRAVARNLGLSGAVLDRDPQVLTRSAASRVGRRHSFGSLRLGAWVVPEPRIDVQRNLNYAALGLDLLGNRTLLFDFPGRRLLFDAAPPPPETGRASAFSTVQTRNADTAVLQSPNRSGEPR